MEIRVLGSGCARCHETERRVMNALAQTGIAADVQKVTDMREIMAYGVMGMPALVINGKVKCYGKIPSLEDVKQWLIEEKS